MGLSVCLFYILSNQNIHDIQPRGGWWQLNCLCVFSTLFPTRISMIFSSPMAGKEA